MVLFPIFTLRSAPSVKYTTVIGTCSDRPSRLSAYIPGVGMILALSRLAMASAIVSIPRGNWPNQQGLL